MGYLSHEDAKKIQTILTGEDETGAKKATTQKCEMSGPLKEYVTLHRHSAIRAELLKHPSVAMRLTVAHMLIGSSCWSVDAQATKSRISVKLEDPYLDKPINAALFHRDDGADLVWSRPKPKNSSE